MGIGPTVGKQLTDADARQLFDELPNSTSDFGVSSNLGVNSATIQRRFEQPTENPKIEDWDRNIRGKPPEDSYEGLILEDAKLIGSSLQPATSSLVKGDRSLPCLRAFTNGMNSRPPLDFHVRIAFDFSAKMSFEMEPIKKSELVKLWLNHIGIEMSGCSLNSVSFMANSLREALSTGAYKGGNFLVFDPGRIGYAIQQGLRGSHISGHIVRL